MEQTTNNSAPGPSRWVLFLYSVPSKPVSNRVTVWRKLRRAGAIPLKGAVYILPFSAEHHELLQWLVAEIKTMGGDGAIVSIARIDTLSEDEIIALFNEARTSDYLPLERELEGFTRKLDNVRKGGQGQGAKGLTAKFEKIAKSFAEIRRTDFFNCPKGQHLHTAIARLQKELETLTGPAPRAATPLLVAPRSVVDYQGRTWVTRKHPFVDRMACAWLIRHAIDPRAEFAFIDEGTPGPEGTVVFDMHGGEFTHVGDLCTFEVLLRAFGLKDKVLGQMAEVVHDLDMQDGKYQAPEAAGIEQVLRGIRKTAADDQAALSRGMEVFADLFASKK